MKCVSCTANYAQLEIMHTSQKGPYTTHVTHSIDIYASFEQKIGVDDTNYEPHLFLIIFAVPF